MSKLWTTDEIAILESSYATKSMKELTELLNGRSVSAIVNKASDLGLKRTSERLIGRTTTKQKFEVSDRLTSVSNLKFARWQPAGRTDLTNGSFKELLRDIEEAGQIVPILITPSGLIIDGHRRTAVADVLGRKIKFYVLPTVAAEGYWRANKLQKAITGSQVLSIYLEEPTAVSPKDRRAYARIEELIGKARLQTACNLGGSLRSWQAAMRAMKHVGAETDHYKYFEWVITTSSINEVDKYLKDQGDPSKMREAINQGQPLG